MPDISVLYRQILAESADNTIVIITVGPLKNIENLIKFRPDSISPLSGKELMNTKIKEFVIMGGKYPSGKNEWNFDSRMKGTTKFGINNITVPITFLGYRVDTFLKRLHPCIMAEHFLSPIQKVVIPDRIFFENDSYQW